MSYWFGAGACITVVDISGNRPTHVWPPEVPADDFKGLGSSWVAHGWVVMAFLDYDVLGGFVLRDKKKAGNIHALI